MKFLVLTLDGNAAVIWYFSPQCEKKQISKRYSNSDRHQNIFQCIFINKTTNICKIVNSKIRQLILHKNNDLYVVSSIQKKMKMLYGMQYGKTISIPYTYRFYANKHGKGYAKIGFIKKKWLVLPKVDFFNEIIVYTHLRIWIK